MPGATVGGLGVLESATGRASVSADGIDGKLEGAPVTEPSQKPTKNDSKKHQAVNNSKVGRCILLLVVLAFYLQENGYADEEHAEGEHGHVAERSPTSRACTIL